MNESHGLQTSPIAAHFDTVRWTQSVPEQQPASQLLVSQMHCPPEHRCPTAHSGDDPHRHSPPLHVSARVASHATQTFPWVPQWVRPGTLQVMPVQHPPVHETELQP